MQQFSTSDAKNRLSELLDVVSAGETIEITRRGKAIARLTQVPASEPLFKGAQQAAQWLRGHRLKVGKIDDGQRQCVLVVDVSIVLIDCEFHHRAFNGRINTILHIRLSAHNFQKCGFAPGLIRGRKSDKN